MSAILLGPVVPSSDVVGRPGPDSSPDYGRVNVGNLLDARHVALAREIAQGITPLDDLARHYGYTGLTDPRWDALMHHPAFVAVLESSVQEWNKATSAPARIALKAAAAVEANIMEMHAGINRPDIPYIQKVEGMKLLSRLAGIGDNAGAALRDGKGGFSVTINIGAGAGQQQVRLVATPPPTPAMEGDSAAVIESSLAE